MGQNLLGIVGIAVAAFAAAAPARAEAPALKLAPYRPDTLPATVLPVSAPAEAPRPAPDLANPLDPLAPTTIQANPLQSEIFARTAAEHRFAGKAAITGSLGFLCGLQPGHGETGGGEAYGIDPHGRFVGAKLSFAFP